MNIYDLLYLIKNNILKKNHNTNYKLEEKSNQ